MDQSSYMRHLYIQAFQNPDKLDYLSNKEYKMHIAEPKYVSIVTLSSILPQQIVRYIIEYICTKECDDLSIRTCRRLRQSVEKGNYNLFEFIYLKEYMEPNIVDFFEFQEDTPYEPHKLYELCTCPKPCGCATNIDLCGYCEPIMFCKYVYIKGCSCKNGKRFLAFCMVYKESYEMIKLTTTKSSNNSINYQKMINLINSSGPMDRQFTLHTLNHTGVL
jgi:hypothetical protein